MPPKLSAIRQFSLQCDTSSSASTRRHSLQKPRSEELPMEEVGIRISLSTKRVPKHPIKIAWDDEDSGNVTRPQYPPFRRHSHQPMGSIERNELGIIAANKLPTTVAIYDEGKTALYSRQDLAQKLHLAWQEKENTKNKLNIFLAPTTVPSADIPESNKCKELPGQEKRTPRREPKITQALLQQPDNSSSTSPTNPSTNLKQIFQKHLRKSRINSPVGSDCEATSQAVVVIPIIERPKPSNLQKTSKPKCEKIEFPNAKKQEHVKVPLFRPQTAIGNTLSVAQKRAMFQKRTNSAFTSINSTCSSPIPSNSHQHQSPPVRQFRPPLIRASSLLTNKKPDIQVKPRLRKKIKLAKRGKHTSKDQEDEKRSDLVTMVSLVSASESEAEDLEEPKNVDENPPSHNVINNTNLKTSPNSPKKQGDKHFSLRKTVKQVSFQHSSIHAVRSFSASFPARRVSVGAALLADNTTKKLPKSLEKRGQTNEGLAEAKRRLLQSEPAKSAFTPKTILATNKQDHKPTLMPIPQEANKHVEEKDENENANNKSEETNNTEFIKEKKCWETYCLMTKSGLNVSFDTILRGMLTPTEYRLRRQLSLERTEETNKHDTSIDDKPTIANEE